MNYRELFSGIEEKIQLEDGSYRVAINLDNAATTPPLKKVDEFIYTNILMYGSVGRGGQKSHYCTQAYEISREEILSFFGISKEDGYTTIYVKNTTEGINLLSNILCRDKTTKVLVTRMEHHANDLPWRRAAQTFYIEVDSEGKINLDELENKLRRSIGTISLVSLTGASNVTGYITPIYEIAQIVHRYGAKLVVDVAQLVAHRAIQVKGTGKGDHIDFIVFSGHKMYAPFGCGVVIGPKEIFDLAPPYMIGGGIVTAVFDNDVYYKRAPEKEEAGTPNFLGAMAIVAATTVLQKIGFEAIEKHEKALTIRLISGLSQYKEVILYGDQRGERVGVVPFNIRGITYDKVGEFLEKKCGIAVRTGCFCAQPYVARLLNISDDERYQKMQDFNATMPGMVRASLGLYNTEEEVDTLIESIGKLIGGKK
ncbi:aminotransferase class V-fold PLP-dependent enzyme [Sporanaerobium hydrogeniformans]|uniref:aminotransferase class V-fold PLP-dependent enzyme n=1 Tax=Sporanaerobium hydrogeniformans TaxID=3072179 RepID=UPI0026B2F990|nr:aminotransferase class V-fold PLP-dependent enzyme [Sporanaerobium hydrogeniformans]